MRDPEANSKGSLSAIPFGDCRAVAARQVKSSGNGNGNNNGNINSNNNRNINGNPMSVYHLSVKVIGRSAGRSATGAAAYRCAEKILDDRTGILHDFTRKRGVEHTELILPANRSMDRAEFWNQVELHHKRGDAVVSREVEVALPDELSEGERRMLALGFARELVERYKVAADVAIHAPSREGDERNHHAHIMLSACTVEPNGTLGKKAGELNPIFCQKHRIPNMADRERERWAELTNLALERAGHTSRVDHRSLEAQGIQRIPGTHMGPAVAGMVRRGASSLVADRMAAQVAERLERAKSIGRLERQMAMVQQGIIDTSGDLQAAIRARDAMGLAKLDARSGVAAFRAQAEVRQANEKREQEVREAFAKLKEEHARKALAEQERNEASARERARQRQMADEQAKVQRGRERQGPSR